MNTIYRIDRACLWFFASQYVSYAKLNEYFTNQAISSLDRDGFITRLTSEEVELIPKEEILQPKPIK